MSEYLVLRRVVDRKGIVTIRWKSDDPSQFRPDEDMFDIQDHALPEDFGKKDKTTTFQPNFVCNVCKTEVSSIKTLQMHCEGAPHIQLLQATLRNQTHQRIEPVEGDLEDIWSRKVATTLPGRGFLIKYLPRERPYERPSGSNKPIYYCTLKQCKTFRGNTRAAIEHVSSDGHKDAAKDPMVYYSSAFKQPMTVIRDSKDYEAAMKNQIVPESFFKTQALLLKSHHQQSARSGGGSGGGHVTDDNRRHHRQRPSELEEDGGGGRGSGGSRSLHYNSFARSPGSSGGSSSVSRHSATPPAPPPSVSERGGGGSDLLSLSRDPNVERFEKALKSSLKSQLELRVESGVLKPDKLEEVYEDLFKRTKRIKKEDHLKRGRPMETIRFTEEMSRDIEGLLEAKFGASIVKRELVHQ